MATSKSKTKTTTKKTTTKTTKKAPVKKATPKKAAPKKATEMVNVDSTSLLDALLPPPQKGASNKKSAVVFDDLPTSVKEHNEKVTSKKSTPKTTKKAPVKKATPKKETSNVDAKKNEKKLKSMTKEEKQMYKKLWEHFNYIANLTMVIEEKMMDPKQIADLTIGEMHVLETVDKYNGQPMTKIANALKVTVGSLTIGVNRLIAKDYLIRVRDEKDHRVVNLSVTPKAKKVLKLHDKFHEDILLGVLDGVTIRDATKVMAQFNRVLENYINPKERTYASTSKVSTK
jgi:DNA-binding MarR family transcriptional regulator